MGCTSSCGADDATEPTTQMESKPTLHYFDVSGRGELSKLICAVGGVEIDVVEYPFEANGASVADKLKAGKMVSAHTTAANEMGMEGCGLPICVHGDLKFNQSMAVQDYFVALGMEKDYPKVTPQQKAVDDMFEGALEDMTGLAAGVVLSGGDAANVPIYMTKTLTHMEKYMTGSGFVNGLAAPTKADLVVLILTQGLIPFGATLGEGAAECYAKNPKAVAVGARTAAFPAVAAYLDTEYCNLRKPPRAAR